MGFPINLMIVYNKWYGERSSLPSKNFLCITMDMLQIGALVLIGRLAEAERRSCGNCSNLKLAL